MPASAGQASDLPNVQNHPGTCGVCPEEKVFSLRVDLCQRMTLGLVFKIIGLFSDPLKRSIN